MGFGPRGVLADAANGGGAQVVKDHRDATRPKPPSMSDAFQIWMRSVGYGNAPITYGRTGGKYGGYTSKPDFETGVLGEAKIRRDEATATGDDMQTRAAMARLNAAFDALRQMNNRESTLESKMPTLDELGPEGDMIRQYRASQVPSSGMWAPTEYLDTYTGKGERITRDTKAAPRPTGQETRYDLNMNRYRGEYMPAPTSGAEYGLAVAMGTPSLLHGRNGSYQFFPDKPGSKAGVARPFVPVKDPATNPANWVPTPEGAGPGKTVYTWADPLVPAGWHGAPVPVDASVPLGEREFQKLADYSGLDAQNQQTKDWFDKTSQEWVPYDQFGQQLVDTPLSDWAKQTAIARGMDPYLAEQQFGVNVDVQDVQDQIDAQSIAENGLPYAMWRQSQADARAQDARDRAALKDANKTALAADLEGNRADFQELLGMDSKSVAATANVDENTLFEMVNTPEVADALLAIQEAVTAKDSGAVEELIAGLPYDLQRIALALFPKPDGYSYYGN